MQNQPMQHQMNQPAQPDSPMQGQPGM